MDSAGAQDSACECACRACVIHALAGAEPCSNPYNSEPFSQTAPYEVCRICRFFSWCILHAMAGTDAWGNSYNVSSSPVLLHISLTELEPPLFWCIIHAVTAQSPVATPTTVAFSLLLFACTLPGLECVSVMRFPGMS